MPSAVAIVVLDYPRLSESFIAQEILALEQRGLDATIVALRRPPETVVSVITRQIRAPVLYLPKFPHREPLRVLRAWWAARRRPTYSQARGLFWRDFMRNPVPDRVLRFLQGLVLSHELDPRITHLHAQFLYYPASVVRYVSLLRGLPWSCSAHAIDIWTLPEWEKEEKLAHCSWAVTCTETNGRHLRDLAGPDKLAVIYHGLDFSRFPPPPGKVAAYSQSPFHSTPPDGGEATPPDGGEATAPVVILSVGRVVEKKGYADLLQALRMLPEELHWKFVHIGAGLLLEKMKRYAHKLGLESKVTWMGPQPPEVVLQQYRGAHLLALACRVAANGDRDGLPNVLLEAQSQQLPVVSTTVSAIPELVKHEEGGLLTSPGDPAAFSAALLRMILDPALRMRLGQAGEKRVRKYFALEPGIDALARRFGLSEKGAHPKPTQKTAHSGNS